MRITNNHNLPHAIVSAVSGNIYPPKEGRYSVTDLVGPPQIRQLKIKNWDELEEDCSDRLWALLGQAVHAVLEHHAPAEALSEEKFEILFDGVVISGRPDILHEKRIEDYKITSVFSFLLDKGRAKPEWVSQLNVYAFLFAKTGRPVSEIWIRAILRDWQNNRFLEPDYPVIPFQSVQVPLWTAEGQERYIRARIEAHQAADPVCGDEERWMRPASWAVMKNANKRAFRVFETEEEAEKLAGTDKALSVVRRKGSYARCERYCVVREFCTQAQQEAV